MRPRTENCETKWRAKVARQDVRSPLINYTLTASDLKQRGLMGSLGVYTLGAYSLGPRILDLDGHSLGAYTLWAYALGANTEGKLPRATDSGSG